MTFPPSCLPPAPTCAIRLDITPTVAVEPESYPHVLDTFRALTSKLLLALDELVAVDPQATRVSYREKILLRPESHTPARPQETRDMPMPLADHSDPNYYHELRYASASTLSTTELDPVIDAETAYLVTRVHRIARLRRERSASLVVIYISYSGVLGACRRKISSSPSPSPSPCLVPVFRPELRERTGNTGSGSGSGSWFVLLSDRLLEVGVVLGSTLVGLDASTLTLTEAASGRELEKNVVGVAGCGASHVRVFADRMVVGGGGRTCSNAAGGGSGTRDGSRHERPGRLQRRRRRIDPEPPGLRLGPGRRAAFRRRRQRRRGGSARKVDRGGRQRQAARARCAFARRALGDGSRGCARDGARGGPPWTLPPGGGLPRWSVVLTSENRLSLPRSAP
jgi:hypothetical protein